jgi:hypothetical protein
MADAENDPSIPDSESLLRRIPSIDNRDMIAVDEGTGRRRLTSACFKLSTVDDGTGKKEPEDGLSVYLLDVLHSQDMDAHALVKEPEINLIVAVPAAVARDLDLGVIPDPWPEHTDEPRHPRNAAHALITGMDLKSRKERGRAARALATAAIALVSPTGRDPIGQLDSRADQ